MNGERAAEAAGYAPATALSLTKRADVRARVQELREGLLKATDITAQRVMLELARVAFADVRKVFDTDGKLIPIHKLDDDAAASIAGIEFETTSKVNKGKLVINLATGEMEPETTEVHTKVAKIKRYNKDAALTTLAKHFKLVGDEGDGVNALANALADRLNAARKRIDIKELPDES
jgi:hypothetical protein